MYKITIAAIIWLLCTVTLALGSGPQEGSAPGNKALEHGHGHQHGEHDLAPSPSGANPSPEQIEQIRKQRAEARAEAEKAYTKMSLSPRLSGLKLGFDDDGRLFELGMSLENAVKTILTGGNRCRVKPPLPDHHKCELQIVTKDKRILSFGASIRDSYLLIDSMTMAKLDSGPVMQTNGPKAAFYLMAFMKGR